MGADPGNRRFAYDFRKDHRLDGQVLLRRRHHANRGSVRILPPDLTQTGCRTSTAASTVGPWTRPGQAGRTPRNAFGRWRAARRRRRSPCSAGGCSCCSARVFGYRDGNEWMMSSTTSSRRPGRRHFELVPGADHPGRVRPPSGSPAGASGTLPAATRSTTGARRDP